MISRRSATRCARVMPEDILKADRMMYAESILALVLGLLVRAAFVLL